MKESCLHANNTVVEAQNGSVAIEKINSSITEITDMTAQIASATEEQSMVAEEINRNIIQISDFAKETIEGSEEAAKCSQEMRKLADDLQSVVKLFVV